MQTRIERTRYSLPLARIEAQQLASAGYATQIIAEHNDSFLVVAEKAGSLNVWAESKDRAL